MSDFVWRIEGENSCSCLNLVGHVTLEPAWSYWANPECADRSSWAKFWGKTREKKLQLSKLHIIPPVAMAFWDAGGTLSTFIICVCSRTGAVKGDAAVWEPVNWRNIPRNCLLWKKICSWTNTASSSLVSVCGWCLLLIKACLTSQSAPEKTLGIGLGETSLGPGFSKC